MHLRFTTGLPRLGVMGRRPEAPGAMTAQADLTETTIDAMAVTMMATEVILAVATGTAGVAEQSLPGERTRAAALVDADQFLVFRLMKQ